MIGSIGTIFFAARSRAFLRREYPLVFFLPLLMAGQLLGYELMALFELGTIRLCAAILAPVLVSALLRPIGMVPFLAGVFTMLTALSPGVSEWSGAVTVSAKLVSELRHHQIGAIEGRFLLRREDPRVPAQIASCRAVYLPWRNLSRIHPGDLVLVKARVSPIPLPLNPLSYEAGQRRHGVQLRCRILLATVPEASSFSPFHRVREHLFTRVNGAFGASEVSGLFLSMVLGFRDLISEHTFHAFQDSGLAHLLVVSGYHVTLIFSLLLFGTRQGIALLQPSQPRYTLAVPLLACIGTILFVTMIGVDSASLRAAVAVCVVVVSRLVERGGGLVHGILLALFFLCLIWPGCFLEPGVQLTFAALIGIAWGSSCRSPRRWIRYLAVCIAPSVTTLGLTVIWFENASVIGFILNPLLAPLASTVFTVGGLGALMLFVAHLDPHGVLLGAMLELVRIFRELILITGSWEWAALEFEPPQSLIVGILLLLVVLHRLLRAVFLHLVEMGIVSVCSTRDAD